MNLTDKDRRFVEDALNRGASERLLVDYFVWRGRYAIPPAPVPREEGPQGHRASRECFRAQVSAEFLSSFRQ